MAFRLHDNAREALQFLALGVGLVLVLRLLVLAADKSSATPPDAGDLDVALDAFRNGYLWQPAGTLVTGGIAIEGRLALAALVALAAGAIAALVAAGISTLLGRAAGRSAVRAARIAMPLVGAWALFAALLLPPRSAEVDNAHLGIIERPALFGELSLPWPSRVERIPWSAVVAVELRSTQASKEAHGVLEQVVVRVEGEERIIASLAPAGRDRTEALAEARDRTGQLAALLARWSVERSSH